MDTVETMDTIKHVLTQDMQFLIRNFGELRRDPELEKDRAYYLHRYIKNRLIYYLTPSDDIYRITAGWYNAAMAMYIYYYEEMLRETPPDLREDYRPREFSELYERLKQVEGLGPVDTHVLSIIENYTSDIPRVSHTFGSGALDSLRTIELKDPIVGFVRNFQGVDLNFLGSESTKHGALIMLRDALEHIHKRPFGIRKNRSKNRSKNRKRRGKGTRRSRSRSR